MTNQYHPEKFFSGITLASRTAGRHISGLVIRPVSGCLFPSVQRLLNYDTHNKVLRAKRHSESGRQPDNDIVNINQ